jgi:uncharacterized protein YhaN
MRLLRVRVKRYGHFVDVPFDFGGEGLQLVLGPNEAGKTTLLQFVWELLFGFAAKNDYDFGHGRLEGEATLRLASGDLVDLRRRKGQKNTVSVRINGRETNHDAGSFNTLLGNATANLFHSVFAFGLAELAAAEKSLADESVRSTLYSGGLANVTSPKKILDELESEASALYRERGQKAVINALCGELRDLQKQVNEKSLRSDAYEEQRAVVEEAAGRAKELDVEVRKLTREHAHTSRLSKALPVWLEWKSLKQDRQGLSVPEGFPVDGKVRFEKLQEKIEPLEGEQATQQAEIGDTERAVENVAVDRRLVQHKADIEQIQRQIQSMRDARRDLPVRQAEKESTLSEVEHDLTELVPGWSTADLEAFRLVAAVRSELDLLNDESQRQEKDKTAQDREHERLAQELRNTTAELARLGDPVDKSTLAALVEAQADDTAHKTELARLQSEERKANHELASLLPRLNPPSKARPLQPARYPSPPRKRWTSSDSTYRGSSRCSSERESKRQRRKQTSRRCNVNSRSSPTPETCLPVRVFSGCALVASLAGVLSVAGMWPENR